MTFNSASPRLVARVLRFAVVLAAAHLTSSLSHAASPSATVVAIEPTRVADLILLRGGFDSGLRQGMVCRVARGGAEIGEILLVELRPGHSAAMILNVVAKQSIRSGDVATAKTLKI